MISGTRHRPPSEKQTFLRARSETGPSRASDRRIRWRAVKLTSLIMFALAAFECGGSKLHYPPAAAGNKAESISVEVDTLKIGSEKYIADLGTITVPENRNLPASRLISIPFLRIRSHASNPSEPVFALAGGPGQSNMAWDGGKELVFLKNHDFVTVGYRGVDGSVALDLPEMTRALKENGDPLSEKSLQAMAAAWNAGAERLKAEGVDLDGYTMLEVVEDNESVRRALGYDRIDLLSESYGTRVAYLYALKHPESVFRSAMIAVNPPGHFVWNANVIDAQLREYSRLWSRDRASVRKSPDLYMSMSRVLRSMPRRWLLFPIDPGKVRVVTFALLFHRSTAAMVFDAYVSAQHGDPSGLALMSLAYDYVLPSLGIWGDLACKAVSADFDSTINYAACDTSGETPLGSPMTAFSWGPLEYSRWPVRTLPEEFRSVHRSDVPTLLISGSVDFSTPPNYARDELLPSLQNGRQVVISECGHVNDLWNVNAANTRLILTSFYDTGTPDTSQNAYVPMDFRITWGFPLIAKVAVATGLLLAGGIFTTIFLLVNRFRRRKRGELAGGAAEI